MRTPQEIIQAVALHAFLRPLPASAARQNAPTSGAKWPPVALGADMDAKRVLRLFKKQQETRGSREGVPLACLSPRRQPRCLWREALFS